VFPLLRDLRVSLDANVSVTAHVTATVRACFAALWQIRSVPCSLSRDALLALVVIKLDCCSSVCWPAELTDKTTAVSTVECSTRLVFFGRRSEHITPLFRELCWFRVPEYFQFHLRFLAYHCLNESVPPYLSETLHLTSNGESSRQHWRMKGACLLCLQTSVWVYLNTTCVIYMTDTGWSSFSCGCSTSLQLTDDIRQIVSSYLCFWRALKSLQFKTSIGDDQT